VTCSPECQRKRKNQLTKDYRERYARKKVPPEAHGTRNGYNIYGCDCPKCRRWARDYKRDRRAATQDETTVTRRSTGRSKAKRSRAHRTRH